MNERGIDWLWHHGGVADWRNALEFYWQLVRPENIEIEREMEALDSNTIINMGQFEWSEWLYDKYFKWKYTAPNRLVTTRNKLKEHIANNPKGLYDIKRQLFTLNRSDSAQALRTAKQIGGLGTAGASGLLGVLFPWEYGVVDQFVVKALRRISDLPQRERLTAMNQDNLTVRDGAILIDIMREKALDNATRFRDPNWTPRMIDKVLWTVRN
jgi:hypothetical protein